VLERWLKWPSSVDAAEKRGAIGLDVSLARMDDLLEKAALDTIRRLQRPGKPDILRKVIGLYLESCIPMKRKGWVEGRGRVSDPM